MAKKSSRGALKAQRDRKNKAQRELEKKVSETASIDKTELLKIRIEDLKKKLPVLEKELKAFIKSQTLHDVELVGSQEDGHFKGHNSTVLNATLNSKRQKVRKCKGDLEAGLEKLYPGRKERQIERENMLETLGRELDNIDTDIDQLFDAVDKPSLSARLARQDRFLEFERSEVTRAKIYMNPETTEAKLAVLSVALGETNIDNTVQECDKYISREDRDRFVGVEFVQRHVKGTVHDLSRPDSCYHMLGKRTSEGDLDFEYVVCDCIRNDRTVFTSNFPTVFDASPRLALKKEEGTAVVSNLKVISQRYQCELGVFSAYDESRGKFPPQDFANVFGVGFVQNIWGICGTQKLLDEVNEWI